MKKPTSRKKVVKRISEGPKKASGLKPLKPPAGKKLASKKKLSKKASKKSTANARDGKVNRDAKQIQERRRQEEAMGLRRGRRGG